MASKVTRFYGNPREPGRRDTNQRLVRAADEGGAQMRCSKSRQSFDGARPKPRGALRASKRRPKGISRIRFAYTFDPDRARTVPCHPAPENYHTERNGCGGGI